MNKVEIVQPSVEVMEETRNLIKLLMDYSVRDGTRIEWREDAKTLALKLAAMNGQTFMVASGEDTP